ncbi:MAG: ATP-binding protein [Planctomycetes bacterium]|nr:ATP-binding protein [Planctomycetota bacterium]
MAIEPLTGPVDPAALLSAAPVPLVAADRAGRMVFASARVQTLLGWPADELVGRPLSDLLPGGAPPPGPGATRARARRRDGGEAEVEVTTGASPGDLTVHALRAVEGPPAPPLEAIGIGTWVWDPVSDALRTSPCALTLLGLPPRPDPLPRARLLAGLHPDDRPAVEAALAQARDPGGELSVEARVVDPDDPAPGARGRWVALRGRSRREGAAVRVEGTVLDVTGARRAAADARFLAEAGRQLARSLDYDVTLRRVARLAVPDLADYCVVDLLEDGKGPPRLVAAAHVDRAAEATVRDLRARYPFDPDASYGVAHVIRTGEPDRQTVDDAWLEAFARGDPGRRQAVEELRLTSYMVVPLAVRGRLLGAVTFVAAESERRYGDDHLALAEEVARRIALAIDNARLYREAQDAIRARDEFLSIASHELRTPLTPLRLQVQALRRLLAAPDRAPAVERLAGKLEMMERQVERLGALVANLLDISRIAAHRLDLRLEEVDLGAVVQEVVARARDDARRGGCELNVRVAPALRGRWDRRRLEQVVSSLLSNALKYGAGAPVDVEVLPGPAGDEARLVVRDRGIGIAPEDQRRIFERFERAVSERNYGGFGLGLWISRQVVEAMGGRIEVESAVGQGATFTAHLPLV